MIFFFKRLLFVRLLQFGRAVEIHMCVRDKERVS